MSGVTVVLDQLVAPVPGGIGRYALNLVRALTERPDCVRPAHGFVSRVDRDTIGRLNNLIPGLDGVTASSLPRAALARLWERGLAVPRLDLSYSPSLAAPLAPHGRHVVTIHDAVPWTRPETLTAHGAAWHRAMGARAERFADIVVVPTHAVADALRSHLTLGDRIRVIGGAPSADLVVPEDAAERRSRLKLPARYLVFVGTLEPRKGLDRLLESLTHVSDSTLVVVGPTGWGSVALDSLVSTSGVNPERVIGLGRLDDADLAAVMGGARALVVPSIDEGFGLPVLEAMTLGLPVLHSTAPALLEVAGGSGVAVDVHGRGGISALAGALQGIDDDALHADLASRGRARAAQFSWAASARALSVILTDLSN